MYACISEMLQVIVKMGGGVGWKIALGFAKKILDVIIFNYVYLYICVLHK